MSPQVHTLPSGINAIEYWDPAAIATTPLSPETCTGTLLFAVLLFPNCPRLFQPHAHTVPSDFTARAWAELPSEAMATTPEFIGLDTATGTG